MRRIVDELMDGCEDEHTDEHADERGDGLMRIEKFNLKKNFLNQIETWKIYK